MSLQLTGNPFVDTEIWRQMSEREVSLVRDALDQIAEIVELERNENLLVRGLSND